MAKTKRIFAGATGLITKTDPVRAGIDWKSLLVDLPVAVNIDISDSYRPGRRKGYVQKVSTPAHSVFCDGGHCLLVCGPYLCRLASDYSMIPIHTLMFPDAKMRYVQVGDEIYFSNTHDLGIYENGAVKAWAAGETPENWQQAGYNFQDPLPARHLEYYNGRLFLAYSNYVIYSQEWAYSWFDRLHNTLPFRGKVRMIRRTTDGLYVGNDQGVFFCGGAGPDEFMVRQVAQEPPIEHTDVRVRIEDFLESSGEAAMWTSKAGVCFGGPQGMYINLTEDRVDLPPALKGCAVVKDRNYLSILKL